TIVVGGAMAIVSLLLMPTITGLYALDTMDAWANNIGIVGSAVLSIVVVAWLLRKLPVLSRHLNAISSFKLGWLWMRLIPITGVVLVNMLIRQVMTFLTGGWEEYPALITGN